MKKQLLLFYISICFLVSCSSVKQTEKALNTGNYDEAIAIAIQKLRTNKTKKNKQPYILMLEQAYAKVVTRDIDHITYLKKEGNNANLERIYNAYLKLQHRQEQIKPLLPLPLIEQNRNANFEMVNYTQDLLDTKKALSTYLYNNALSVLNNARNKNDYRLAYDDFKYLDNITPNYKDVRQLIDEAHYKGTDFVIVAMSNQTDMIIPERLESDLLNFSTYGLNDLWTVYHSQEAPQTSYDYRMNVDLREINISPERIRERYLEKEKVIKDGWEYLLDENGDPVLDENGKKIKVDKTKKVYCEYFEFIQSKAVNVVGNVSYINLRSQQLLDNFPLASEFIFEHTYANHRGDKRALDKGLLQFLALREIPFPSNEQMVYDTAEDLKAKLKHIITTYQFNK